MPTPATRPHRPARRPPRPRWVRRVLRGGGVCRPVPAAPAIRAGLLAQFTGHLSIAAALRPHAGIGQDQAHRSLSTAITAPALPLPRDVRVDQWLLYHPLSTSAAGGMTHSECRVHDEAGDL